MRTNRTQWRLAALVLEVKRDETGLKSAPASRDRVVGRQRDRHRVADATAAGQRERQDHERRAASRA